MHSWRDRLSQGLRHPWAPSSLVLLGGMVLVTWAVAPLDFQATHASTDDSFYYYAWARNVAQGLGPTADGITPTNGVQPLWALILAALAVVVRDAHHFVDAALLLCLLLDLAAGAIWIRLAHRWGGVWLGWATAVVLARALVRTQWVVLTGMEISLNLFLGSLLVLAVVESRERGWSRPRRDPLLFGALVALLLLGRPDNSLYLIGPVLLELGLRAAGRRGLFPFVQWRHLPWLALPAVVGFTPYLLWNKTAFGAWLPVSGKIKLLHSQQAFESMGVDSLAERLAHAARRAWEGLGRPVAWSATALVSRGTVEKFGASILAALLLAAYALTPPRRRRWLALGVGIAFLVLFPRQLVYGWKLASTATHYSVWYLALEWLAAVLLVGVLLRWALELIPEWKGVGPWLRAGVLVALCVSFFPAKLQGYLFEREKEVTASRGPMAKVAALRWAEENLPDDAVVGSFNSGIMHYYARQIRVINLDGRVDDGSLYRTLLAGGSTLDNQRRRGITHVIDTIWDDGYWQRMVEEGRILHRVPYGNEGDKTMVVLELPSARSEDASGRGNP